MGGDLMTVPSVGSPGSAAASPHPNSQLSQPSSVPPVDQLMSPRPPPSVPTNLQQPNTPLEHLLDKNTPAPTPTDQHDNKSITASPYIHQNPSIEAPLLAHLASGLCEPQPIPALIVGHEKDWLSVAPYAIHYWDKLLLEPYSYSKDIAFMVVCPDNEDVLANSKMYFKELSTTYEMCRLGRHTPMTKWNGFLPVNSGCILPNQQRTSLDDWFDSLPDRRFGEQLKMYAHALMRTGGNTGVNIGAPTSPQSHESSMTAEIKPPISPIKQEPGTESNGSTVTNEPATSNAAATILHDPMSEDDDINPPIIVVYLVEPFTYGNDSPDVQRVACLALLRSFSEMLNALPESIRGISLTGFGTAANIEHFLKSKDDKNRLPYKMFTP
uniref:Mediator of RNA polymerase II transcription subunit 13 n=1 Tax=Megaselia scalaris TaxID=36166 RepID=T1H4N6_MEGSC